VSREDGFSRADIDATMLDDLKFRRLWKQLGHQGLMAEATAIYLATVLRSWHDAMPVEAEDAVPTWLNPTPETLAALVHVGLLDKDHRIPKRAFQAWFRPAWERRERWRQGGRVGAERRWGDQSGRQADRQAGKAIGEPIATPLAPRPVPDDPNDAVLIEKLRRYAASEDELVAKHAQERLSRMGVG